MNDFSDMRIQLMTELAGNRTRELHLLEAIASLDRLVGQGSIVVEMDPTNPTPFRDFIYGDAVEQLLTAHGPQGTRELADALLRGGARNLISSLYTLLRKDGRFRLEGGKRSIRGSSAVASVELP